MSAGSAGEDLGTAVRRTEPRQRGAVTQSKDPHRSAGDLARDPGAASIADHENPLPLSGGASEDGARPANSVIHPVLPSNLNLRYHKFRLNLFASARKEML